MAKRAPVVATFRRQATSGVLSILSGAKPEPMSHKERRIMRHSPEQMYSVVADVAKYQEFVPWCMNSTVLSETGDEYLEAELGVGFRLFTERYVSRVTLSRPEHVRAEAANTQLFSSLVNEWRFLPGPEPGTTWLEFRVDFAFKSALYAQASAMFLDEVARRMVSAFEARCDELYGPGAGGASSARLAARERSEREQSQAGDGGSEGGSDGTTEGGAGRGAGAQEEAKEAAGGAVGAAPPSTPGGRPSVARQTAPARPSQGSGLGGSGGVAISSGLSVLRPRRAHRPPPLPDKGSSLW